MFQDVQDALETLDEVKEMVGAKNLKELILKMKNDLSSALVFKKEELKAKLAENPVLQSKSKPLEEEPKQQLTNEETKPNINKIVEEAKNKIKSIAEANEKALEVLKTIKTQSEKAMSDAENNEENLTKPEEVVGSSLSVNQAQKPEEPLDNKEKYFRDQVDTFLQNLFMSKYKNKQRSLKPSNKDEQEAIIQENIKDVFGEPPKETVGAGLQLSENLMKPFMGLPSKTELKDFLESYGDDPDLIAEDVEKVGAINPTMFKKVTKEPLKIKPSAIVDDHGNIYTLLDDVKVGVANEEDARMSLAVPKKLLKPYMGKMKKRYYNPNKYFGIYNDDYGYLREATPDASFELENKENAKDFNNYEA